MGGFGSASTRRRRRLVWNTVLKVATSDRRGGDPVHDNGIGTPIEIRDKLFKRLFSTEPIGNARTSACPSATTS
jgi:hypothetical protein